MTTKALTNADSKRVDWQVSSLPCLLFSEKKIGLNTRLKECIEGFSITDYSYLVKGDVSGIQDFIFSVKSDKASKSLKGRSFFVQALSKLGIHLLERELLKENTKVFYDGGGNFYLLSKVPVSEAVEKARETIDQHCKASEIYLSLAEMHINSLTFTEVWSKINRLSNESKLRKFSSDVFNFNAYPGPKMELDSKPDEEVEKDFRYDRLTEDSLKNFNRKFGFDPATEAGVDGVGISFFGSKMVLGAGSRDLEDWVNGLPKWSKPLPEEYDWLVKKRQEEADGNPKIKAPKSGNIIEFSDLAAFAHARNGTEKIAVLKMDVDNLGKLFKDLKDWPDAKRASAAMSWFFGAFMSDLLLESFQYKGEAGETQTAKFSDNIYVVFSGGDDTFMVGAWDAVFEFAYCLHQNFNDFTAELQKQQIKGLPEKITLSAALVVVDPKFPVVGFADRAEKELGEAKRWENEKGERCKNMISVFGQILDWNEFGYARDLAIRTANLIQFEGESRAIIERVKHVARDYERLQERVADGRGPGPKVHRLFYTMRNLKNLKAVEEDIKSFSTALLDAFTKGKKVSYPKFPVAARWAEFLTRK